VVLGRVEVGGGRGGGVVAAGGRGGVMDRDPHHAAGRCVGGDRRRRLGRGHRLVEGAAAGRVVVGVAVVGGDPVVDAHREGRVVADRSGAARGRRGGGGGGGARVGTDDR